MTDSSLTLAMGLRDQLATRNLRLVLAESCTAGRVAATLSSLPGISQWLCGSFVVYRCDSKTKWLGVPASLLADPAIGPVSRGASRMLAIAALARTPEAQLAIAVTGDVGPGAPASTDGRLFCACQFRQSGLVERAISLTAPTPTGADDVAGRIRRLDEATNLVLAFAVGLLTNQSTLMQSS